MESSSNNNNPPALGLRKGAWTKEEDDRLRQCIGKYGEGKWHQVPLRARLNRCRKSCRLRWLNYLRPNIKRGCFGKDEVDLIVRLHKLLGNRWSLIAGRIPGRTANDVKNYWNSHVAKKLNNNNNNNNSNVTLTSRRHSVMEIPNKQPQGITKHEIVRPRPRPRTFMLEPPCSNNSALLGEPNDCTTNHEEPSPPAPPPPPSRHDDESVLWWSNLLEEAETMDDHHHHHHHIISDVAEDKTTMMLGSSFFFPANCDGNNYSGGHNEEGSVENNNSAGPHGNDRDENMWSSLIYFEEDYLLCGDR